MESAVATGGAARAAARPGSGDGPRLALLAGCLLVLGMLSAPLARELRPAAGAPGQQDGAAWEGRRMLAQMLWVRTHAVLHAGVEERSARPGEETSRAGEFHRPAPAAPASVTPAAPGHRHGDGCGHAHGGEGHEGGHVFVIPPAREDFRGLLGDLERAVKPYAGRDGRLYAKDEDQTVPFYRLMTWADPHFIQGYVVGATFICRAGKYVDEALAFLHEGERLNPGSFEIQTELGRFYLVYRKDHAAAERHLRRAVALAPVRPEGEMEEEARIDAYRWRALNFVAWGRPAEALRAAEEGRRAAGDDVTFRSVIARRGLK